MKHVQFLRVLFLFTGTRVHFGKSQTCLFGLRDINRACGVLHNAPCVSVATQVRSVDEKKEHANDGNVETSYGSMSRTQPPGYIEFDLEYPQRIDEIRTVQKWENLEFNVKFATIRVGDIPGCLSPSCGLTTWSASVTSTNTVPCGLVGRYICIDSGTISPARTFTYFGEIMVLSCGELVCPDGSVSVQDCACSAGHFGSAGVCTPCLPGHFKSESGDGECIQCAPGKYAPLQGTSTCADCPYGTYVEGPGALVCTTCLEGESSIEVGGSTAGVCVLCSAGKFKSNIFGTPCTDCGAGRYANMEGATVCTDCEAGSTGSNSAEACVLCVFGTFKTVPGSAACTSCDSGKFSAVTGSDSNVCTCNAGSTGSDGIATCVLCEFGTYKVNTGSAACTACDAGKFSGVAGSTSCMACSIGKFSSVAGSAYCTACGLGKFSTVVGSDSNVCTCNAGSTGLDGPDVCTSCDSGTYKVDTGSASCTACDAGKFSGVAGSTSCMACGTGKFSSVAGSAYCTACGLGKFSTVVGSNSNVCKCNAGSTGLDGSDVCTSCDMGTYKTGVGSAACTKCGIGKYSTAVGAILDVCQACPLNSVSVVGSDEITDCMCIVGFTGISGETYCSSCIVGTYKSAIGSHACDTCPVGTYNDGSYNIQCNTCPPDATSPEGSISDEYCLCNPNFYKETKFPYMDLAQLCGVSGNQPCALLAQQQQLPRPVQTSTFRWNSRFSNLLSNFLDGSLTSQGVPTNGWGHNFWIRIDFGMMRDISSLNVWNSPLAWRTQLLNGVQVRVGSSVHETAITCATLTASMVQTHNCKARTQYLFLFQPPNGNAWQSIGLVEIKVYGTLKIVTCKRCPTASLSPINSTAVTDCTCNSGYTGDDGGACTACVPGKYKVAVGAIPGVCQACPSNSDIPAEASGSPTDCKCNSGYTGDNSSVCSACVAGKYKTSIGSVGCTDCLRNQYSAGGSATCSECGTNSESPTGSSSCICSAGTQQDAAGHCTACVAGKYKTTLGNDLCTNCLSNQYSVAVGATSDTCNECVSNSQSPAGSGALSSCICNAGATGPDGGACVQCVAGKYKTTIGNIECTHCLTNQYSAAVGATSNTCGGCVVNSQSPAGSGAPSSCICNTGATGPDGGTCVHCVGGKYKNSIGSEACTNCPPDTDAPEGSRTISACACPAGVGKNRLPVVTCTGICPCPGAPTQYSGQFLTTIPNMWGVYEKNSNCIWTIVSDGLTSLHFSGTFDIEANYDFVTIWTCTSASCDQSTQIVRVSGTSAPSISTMSKVFRVQFTSDAHKHRAGFVLQWNTVEGCASCIPGKYKIDIGNGGCSDCLANEYSTAVGASVCQACGTNSASPPASSICVCNAGTQQDAAGNCMACVIGKYKTTAGNDLCTDCLSNQYSTAVGATSNTCSGCVWNSQSPAGSGTLSSCICNAGVSGPDGGACVQCVAGKYKTSTGSAECTDCVVAKFSTAVAAVSNVCEACPSNTVSAIGSDEITDCICNVGYDGPAGETCTLQICGAGSTGPDVGPCVPCVAGKYKGDIGSAECTNCVAGKYSIAVAAVSDICQNCPLNTVSAIGSDEITDCICNVGWTGSGGEAPCSACTPGTYKSSLGSDTCENCVAGTYSTSSNSITSDVCLSCPSNSDSAEASDSAADCICNAGFSGVRGELCTQCAVGKFRAAPSGI